MGENNNNGNGNGGRAVSTVLQVTLSVAQLLAVVVAVIVGVLTIKSDLRNLETVVNLRNEQTAADIAQLRKDVALQGAWQRVLEQQLIAAGVIKAAPFNRNDEP